MTIPARAIRLRFLFLLVAVALMGGACGPASLSPIVAEEERQFDPALWGTWVSVDSAVRAEIEEYPGIGYSITLHEEDGKVSHLVASLGTLGTHRVLDVMPEALPREMGPTARDLFLPVHGLAVLHSLDATELRYRLLVPDSLRAALEREPALTPHVMDDRHITLTGDTPEVRRFFIAYLRRPGVLTEMAVMKRRAR